MDYTHMPKDIQFCHWFCSASSWMEIPPIDYGTANKILEVDMLGNPVMEIAIQTAFMFIGLSELIDLLRDKIRLIALDDGTNEAYAPPLIVWKWGICKSLCCNMR